MIGRWPSFAEVRTACCEDNFADEKDRLKPSQGTAQESGESAQGDTGKNPAGGLDGSAAKRHRPIASPLNCAKPNDEPAVHGPKLRACLGTYRLKVNVRGQGKGIDDDPEPEEQMGQGEPDEPYVFKAVLERRRRLG